MTVSVIIDSFHRVYHTGIVKRPVESELHNTGRITTVLLIRRSVEPSVTVDAGSLR